MLTLAVFAPALVGVNVTLTVQVAPAASESPQVVVRANWFAFAPVSVIALAAPPVKTSAPTPSLAIVNTFAALVESSSWPSNPNAEGLMPTVGLMPVPSTPTDAGLPAASCAILTLALFVPVEVGVNVTLTVQVAPAASVAPQVVVRANWLASVPVRVIALAPPPVKTRSAVPVLLMVTDCAVLVTVVRWLPKLRLVGLTPMIGVVPVPLNATLFGLPAALCAMLTLALLAPVLVGVNVTDTVQFAPTASDAPQVVVRAN
jgi:hypothetical protein